MYINMTLDDDLVKEGRFSEGYDYKALRAYGFQEDKY